MIYIAILAVLWIVFPMDAMLHPHALDETQELAETYHASSTYIRGTFTNLTFCGYTKEIYGQTVGYYYYGVRGDQCYIILLSPSSCEEGLPTIDSITVTCRILEGSTAYNELLMNLAEDLNWTTDGISNQLSSYYYSEPGYLSWLLTILYILYFGTLAYAVLSLVLYCIYIRFPVLSPPCLDMAIYGHPIDMLAQAEEELATLPQLATEDMFITEHYFILTSPYGNAIVPIQEILWIYKYSTLHKILWYHFSISYTLHITANKHYYVRCPKNLKSDIDGIIDYLSEANHNILVGFSEENRIKVQNQLGKPFHIEKLFALLHRKI
ncbi:MAG: hypothetical protein LIO37_03395 [Clostridiales bacterium]|nr:hypothetical protein [Clostridiales bacterium]